MYTLTIHILKKGVKRKTIGAHPQFFPFAHNRVGSLRGFIRPALRANRVEIQQDLEPRFILETYAANL